MAASDLEEEAPIWWLRVKAAAERGASLIVINPRETKLERYANQVIRYSYSRETRTLLDLKDKENETFNLIKKAENLLIFFGFEGMDHKASRAFSRACANLLIENKKAGQINSGLIPVWPGANTQGAWEMGFEPADDLAASLEKAETLLVAGTDPAASGYASQLVNKFVIVFDLFQTETTEMADLVLPAAAPIEKSGTFTSGDRRLQLIEKALEPKGESLPDYLVVSKLANLIGHDIGQGDSADILGEIINNVSGYGSVTMAGLRNAPEQWPFVSKEALSFTGTVFKNTSGIGMYLDPAADPSKMKIEKVSQPRPKFSKGNIAVPIIRFYDLGIMIKSSTVLEPLLGSCRMMIHPDDAVKFGLDSGDQVEVKFENNAFRGQINLGETVPPGVLLVPRRMGAGLASPENVEIKKLD